MKQYFYISLLLYTIINISFVLTAPETYVNNGTSNHIQAQASSVNSTGNTTNVLLTEGGKVDLTPNISHQGREHVVISTSTTTVSTTIEKTSNGNATSTKQQTSTTSKSDTTTPTSIPKEAEIKPVTDVEHHGRVQPRKGVNFTSSVGDDIKATNPINSTSKINIPISSTMSTNVTTQKSTTTTVSTTLIPKKPTITFGSDEDDLPPRVINTKVFVRGKQINPNSSSSESSAPAHTGGDPVIVGNRNYAKGSDYVLPIVLTILAVPLLAIILTVVYKRGAEWWNHRHYRRMDFLIDGMYNN